MLVSRKQWQAGFDGHGGDPNIIDGNHQAALFQVIQNVGIKGGSVRRDVKYSFG
jgi:hypothetical protein